MKKLYLMLLLTAVHFACYPQSNNSTTGAAKEQKFFVGLNYSYLDSDLKLLSMTKHSVWDGTDFGTIEVEQDQIDTLNSFINYNERLQYLYLTAGMVLLNNPTSPWYIDGHLVLGHVKRENSVINSGSDITEQDIESENFSPMFGIGFNFSYRLNEKWKIKLAAQSLYSSGTTDKIEDNVFLKVPGMDESRKSKLKESYSRLDFLASYQINSLTISAGPGFCFLYNTHKYEIVRTNPEDGKIYEDTIETSLKNKTFINGGLYLGWKFADHFQLNAGSAVSNDLMITGGIVYTF